MNNRTIMQTLLLAVGAVVLVGGLVCVVTGFVGFAGSAPGDGGSSMALFAAGGFAAVVGLAIVGFTRVAILSRNGGYARVTIEQGRVPGGGRFCPRCGTPVSTRARFCESCGSMVG